MGGEQIKRGYPHRWKPTDRSMNLMKFGPSNLKYCHAVVEETTQARECEGRRLEGERAADDVCSPLRLAPLSTLRDSKGNETVEPKGGGF